MQRTVAFIAVAAAGFIAAGCGEKASTPAPKPGQAASTPATPAPAPAAAPAPTPGGAPPPPPPGAGAQTPTAAPASPVAPAGAEGPVDVAALQKAIFQYRMAQSLSLGGDNPLPELTQDLTQLVKVGIIKSLPEPPAGQKFQVDLKNGKLSTVPM